MSGGPSMSDKIGNWKKCHKKSTIFYLHSSLTTCCIATLNFWFVMLLFHFRISPFIKYSQPLYWQSGRLIDVRFSTVPHFFRSLLYIMLFVPWSVWMLNFSSIRRKYLAIHLIICFLFFPFYFSIFFHPYLKRTCLLLPSHDI